MAFVTRAFDELKSVVDGLGTTARITYGALSRMTSTNTLQWAGLTWDQLWNILERDDYGNSLDEKYAYDELNRLKTITLNGNAENSFTYDALGNMLTKGDVGTYAYPPAGSARPHGVTRISPGGGNSNSVAFAYDGNGNLTSETGTTTRTITPAIFNMTRNVTYAGKEIIFQYDADQGRVLQTAPEGTTYYLPDEELTPGNVWHTYFEVDGQRVAEDYGPTGALKHHYFHNDDQNTIGLITDDTFNATSDNNVQNELSDVFGQPRLTTGATDPTWGVNDVSKRRYINQEDLTDAHLIDLNARLYDPLLGKFMAPDPVIVDQDDSQSWNAYAYVHNNPMSREDPTGLEDVTVPPGPSGGDGPFSAHGASVRPDSSGAFLHIPSGILSLAARAAISRNALSVASRALSSGYGLTVSVVSELGGVAETIAIGNPFTGGVVLAVIPTQMGSKDTTQGCGGPCDAPGAGNQATSPEIKPEDLQGKTKEEVEQLAKDKGLVQDANKPNKYRDPNTGKERLRIDPGHIDQTTGKPYNNPNAAQPHVHGYDSSGAKIRDPDTNDPHFPLSPGQ